MLLGILVAVLAILLLYYCFNMKPKNFPPGPPCLPFLGSLPFTPLKNLHLTMAGPWLQKYGPVVGLVFGKFPALAICGSQAVFEVLRRDEFQGRPDDQGLRERFFNKRLGVLFTDGPYWVEQRRFTIRHLRDFGFGKKSAEITILEEVEEVIREFKEQKIIQVPGPFSVSSINVLWSMIAGTRYAHDDADFKALLHRLDFLFDTSLPRVLANMFPILKKIAPGLCGHKKFMESFNELQSFFRTTIHEHKLMLEENNPRDFIDVFLRHIEAESGVENSTFTEEGLIILCLDLFFAGAKTVSDTLSFCLLYMVVYPEVQEAVQKELDTVIGRNRRPSLDDRPKLPIVEATIAEICRINTTAPLALPHSTTKDTELNGYNIKKDTVVVISLWSVLHDREHWGDPEVFRPERFLDTEGKFVRDEWLVHFGIGKRTCLGEVLAKSMLFLFFSTLLQEFTFKVPDGDPKPTTEAQPGFTTTPKPFRVEVIQRC